MTEAVDKLTALQKMELAIAGIFQRKSPSDLTSVETSEYQQAVDGMCDLINRAIMENLDSLRGTGVPGRDHELAEKLMRILGEFRVNIAKVLGEDYLIGSIFLEGSTFYDAQPLAIGFALYRASGGNEASFDVRVQTDAKSKKIFLCKQPKNTLNAADGGRVEVGLDDFAEKLREAA